MIRETIYAALFAKFATLTSGTGPLFKTATRKAKTWEDVSIEDQPAVLLVQKRETVERGRGLPSRWVLHVDVLLYAHTAANMDPDVTPSQILNPLMDAVEGALSIDDYSNNTCTLGGLAHHVCIDGTVEYFEGDLGDQACAVIPITIVVPT